MSNFNHVSVCWVLRRVAVFQRTHGGSDVDKRTMEHHQHRLNWPIAQPIYSHGLSILHLLSYSLLFYFSKYYFNVIMLFSSWLLLVSNFSWEKFSWRYNYLNSEFVFLYGFEIGSVHYILYSFFYFHINASIFENPLRVHCPSAPAIHRKIKKN